MYNTIWCYCFQSRVFAFLTWTCFGYIIGITLLSKTCTFKWSVAHHSHVDPDSVGQHFSKSQHIDLIQDDNNPRNIKSTRNLEALKEVYQRDIQRMDSVLSDKSQDRAETMNLHSSRNPEDLWVLYKDKEFIFTSEVLIKDRKREKQASLQYHSKKIAKHYNMTYNRRKDILNKVRSAYCRGESKGDSCIVEFKGKIDGYGRKFISRRSFKKLEAIERNLDKNGKIRINFIVSIAGKNETFQKFMKLWKNDILRFEENASLTFVVSKSNDNGRQYEEIRNRIKSLQLQYPLSIFNVIQIKNSFQRAQALDRGADLFPPDSLLFFIDIDCTITRNTLTEIRKNTIRNKQVYFPIVFSEYDPKFVNYNSSLLFFEQNEYAENEGYWRSKGFGMISIYKSDYSKVGGLNTKIKSWGMEDTNFADRVIRKRIRIFRAPSPGLKHIYHPKDCGKQLHGKQLKYCKEVKERSEYSSVALAAVAYDLL